MEESEVSIADFVHLIEWKSPFVVTLLVFQLVWFILTIISVWTRRFRITLVSITAAGVFFAEKINTVLTNNWYDLGLKRNIFDRDGFFMFCFWAIPLTFDIFLLVLSFLRELCETMAMSLKIKAAMKTKRE